jgi:hypothetical protein
MRRRLAVRQTNRRVDQPVNFEGRPLNAGPGSIEVFETSRAFLRSGIVAGIDGLRHPLRYVLRAGFHRDP